ncbi:glycosyltransferase [Planctomycetota bacterium]
MITLLYSGNLGIGQDLHTLLHAVAGLNGDADLRVSIVGSGKGLPAVRQLAAERKIRNVEFCESVPLHQLPDLLAQGDIHVICQQPGTEGLLVPSKIYGTLSVGRPSIFFGPQECEVSRIIQVSRSGFVVEPGDAIATMAALITLARSEEMRREMGLNARRYYTENFGRRRSVARIIDVIEVVGRVGHTVRQSDSRTGQPSDRKTVATSPPTVRL